MSGSTITTPTDRTSIEDGHTRPALPCRRPRCALAEPISDQPDRSGDDWVSRRVTTNGVVYVSWQQVSIGPLVRRPTLRCPHRRRAAAVLGRRPTGVKPALAALNLPHSRWHDLRHTFAVTTLPAITIAT